LTKKYKKNRKNLNHKKEKMKLLLIKKENLNHKKEKIELEMLTNWIQSKAAKIVVILSLLEEMNYHKEIEEIEKNYQSG
jgi:hypothetical protein